jgi:hypothetical protein
MRGQKEQCDQKRSQAEAAGNVPVGHISVAVAQGINPPMQTICLDAEAEHDCQRKEGCEGVGGCFRHPAREKYAGDDDRERSADPSLAPSRFRLRVFRPLALHVPLVLAASSPCLSETFLAREAATL